MIIIYWIRYIISLLYLLTHDIQVLGRYKLHSRGWMFQVPLKEWIKVVNAIKVWNFTLLKSSARFMSERNKYTKNKKFKIKWLMIYLSLLWYGSNNTFYNKIYFNNRWIKIWIDLKLYLNFYKSSPAWHVPSMTIVCFFYFLNWKFKIINNNVKYILRFEIYRIWKINYFFGESEQLKS